MFSSKTPRDLNHDPAPWWHDHYALCDVDRMSGDHPERSAQKEAEEDEFLPRPEFDHVQHNEPNVILVAIRVLLEDADEASAAFYADPGKYLTGGTHALGIPIQERMSDHARRVLSRLAALRSSST